MIFFLIGLPGVGKTYYGRKWADNLGCNFIDLDETIKTQSGQSVPQIFDTIGELEFRKLERKVLQESIQNATEPTIIACGGGTPCHLNNTDVMLASGKVVWLHNTVANIVQQLMPTVATRPLLKGIHSICEMEKKIQELLNLRTPFYAQAHQVLMVDEEIDSKFATYWSSFKRTNNYE